MVTEAERMGSPSPPAACLSGFRRVESEQERDPGTGRMGFTVWRLPSLIDERRTAVFMQVSPFVTAVHQRGG